MAQEKQNGGYTSDIRGLHLILNWK